MNVPTLPGEQQGAIGLPATYSQVTETTAAPYLGALGDAAAKFGAVAEQRAQLVQARQDQTAIFNYSADARARADEGLSQFNQLNGQDAINAGPEIIAGFRKWADERAANLSPLQKESARQHAEDLAYGLSKAIDDRTLVVGEQMRNASLANLVQTETQSAGTVALLGGVTMSKPSMRTATPGSYNFPKGVETTLDERPLMERWNAIESAIKEHVKASGGNTLLGQQTTERLALEKARTDFVLTVTDALVRGKDYRLAKAYWDKHRTEVKDSDAQVKTQDKVDAAVDIGDTSRATREIFATYAGTGGTWAERLDPMLKDAGKLRDEISGKVSAGLRAMVSTAREEENRASSETTEQLLDALDKGAQPVDVAKGALDLPEKFRAAVALGIENKAKRIVADKQGDLYQEWLTKAAGINPETGERDPAMREEFLAHQFATEIPSFAREDYGQLTSLQKEGLSGGGQDTDSIISDESIADNVTTTIYPSATGADRAVKLYQIKRQLGALWKSQRGDGPPLSLEAKAKQGDALAAQSVFDRPHELGTGPSGEPSDLTFIEVLSADPTTIDVSDLPDDQRKAAEAALRLVGITHPTDAQIVKQYQNAILAGLRHGAR